GFVKATYFLRGLAQCFQHSLETQPHRSTQDPRFPESPLSFSLGQRVSHHRTFPAAADHLLDTQTRSKWDHFCLSMHPMPGDPLLRGIELPLADLSPLLCL